MVVATWFDPENPHLPQSGIVWALSSSEAFFENDVRPFAFWIPRDQLRPVDD